MFSKNIRIIYLYLVSFITLCILVGSIIYTTASVAELYFPQSYEITPMAAESSTAGFDANSKTAVMYPDYQANQNNTRNQNIKNIVTGIATMLVAGTLFTYHWTRIQKELTVSSDKQGGTV